MVIFTAFVQEMRSGGEVLPIVQTLAVMLDPLAVAFHWIQTMQAVEVVPFWRCRDRCRTAWRCCRLFR